MPKFPDIVDIEAALIAYFKGVSAITAITTPARISTELPKDFGKQASTNNRLQLFRSGGGEVNFAIDRPLIDFNIFGDTQAKAQQLMKAVNLAVQQLIDANLPSVVVTRTERVSGPAYYPDPDTDVPRYLVTWALITHPRPA